MATTYEQLPAELNISFVKGDEVGVLLTLNGLDLTNYTFDSRVYARSTVAAQNGGIGAGASTTGGQTAAAFTVTLVNATAGQVNISMQENVSDTLQANGDYRWWFRATTPGLVTRTWLSGQINVVNP